MTTFANSHEAGRSRIGSCVWFARATLRGLRLWFHICYGLMLAAIFPALKCQLQWLILRRWSSRVLEILNVHLEVRGTLSRQNSQGILLVANHISWLDIFAINAICPAGFVAKSEVGRWPIIGILCKRARTIFIARNNRRDTLRTNQAIGDRIAKGECVALFPEGTSTDGTDVGHFHSSLLQSAIDSNCPVLPIAIRYQDAAGNLRHESAFIGDMTFVQSLKNILSCDQLRVCVALSPALNSTGKDRRRLASEAHTIISDALENMAGGKRSSAAHIHAGAPDLGHAIAAPRKLTPAFRSVFSLLINPATSKSEK